MKKNPIEELLERICGQINTAHKQLVEDCNAIWDREQDVFYRDHEIIVRRARFTLETASLERQRMSLVRELAVYNPMRGIIKQGPMA